MADAFSLADVSRYEKAFGVFLLLPGVQEMFRCW
jgi:hypothetical protein